MGRNSRGKYGIPIIIIKISWLAGWPTSLTGLTRGSGWLASWLDGWQVWLDGWLVWLARLPDLLAALVDFVDWLAVVCDWLAGWLVGYVAGSFVV
jgi:hypothetical protein